VFTVADGLPANGVRRLEQGADGYLYVGTGRGLVRYDGYGFETVPLDGFRTRRILGIHQDDEGRIWVWSQGGDLGYVREGRVPAMSLPPGTSPERPQAWRGAIWLGGDAGLRRHDPATGEWTTFTRRHGLPTDTVVGVVATPDGERVLITAQGLVRMTLDPDDPDRPPRFRPIEPSFRPAGRALRATVHADRSGMVIMAEAGFLRYGRSGIRWLSDTLSRGSLELEEFAPSRQSVHPRIAGRIRTPADFPQGIVRHVLRLPGGSRDTGWVVFAPAADGRARLFRRREGRFDRVELAEHLDFRSVVGLLEDDEGSLWIGTDRGLIQLAPRRVAALPSGGLAEGFTTGVLQGSDGSVWVATWGGGLHRFLDGHLEARLTASDGLTDDRVRSLFEAEDGMLWVGGRRGYVALRPARGGGGRPPVAPTYRVVGRWEVRVDDVRDFAETRGPDGRRRLWVAAGDSLLVGTPSQEAAGTTTFAGFRPQFAWGSQIWALHAARDGSLWVGGTGGLFRIVGDTVHRFGTGDGLRSVHVSSIHEEEDGTLWIGTYEHGLHRYRGGRFVPVTTREGLHHDGVWAMVDDGLGFVWMSSDGGVFRVARTRLHDVADAVEAGVPVTDPLEPLVFTESEGMPSRESNRASPGGWRLSDGRIVFNNIAGVVVVDPQRAARRPPPPPIRLRRVIADGRRATAGAAPLELPAGIRHLTFEFSALSFTAPEQNRYRYRLDGYDEAWVESGTRRTASYTGLPPGRYTFRVQGATGTGPWSETEARRAVVVPPLLWQAWWFRGVLAALLLGFLAAAYRYRVGHLLAVERLRLRIAADLHDDVGSNLSSIALLTEMLESGSGDPARRARQLRRISRAADETVRSLREIIWIVDPKHDNLEDLVRRMRATAGEMLDGAATFTAPSDLDRRTLDPRFVRQVFLLYKEAIQNAVKHAGTGGLTIRVDVEGDALAMRIEDTGPGFREDEVRPGYGLRSMRRRAEEVGGELRIQSAEGQGTRITFRARMA
jgi:signal transduction histidine kinase/ligand-binding sensor domain-containing protein